jgi:hypothetical protein
VVRAPTPEEADARRYFTFEQMAWGRPHKKILPKGAATSHALGVPIDAEHCIAVSGCLPVEVVSVIA